MLVRALLKLALMAILLGGAVNGQIRIPGGTEVVPHSLPYQILVKMITSTHRYTCNGAVYDRLNVVTTAHCCFGDITVYAGVHNVKIFDSKVQTISVERVKIHEKYNKGSYKNDVCMLHLKQPFIFNDYVQPAKLPRQNQNIQPHSTAFVAGWGLLSKGSPPSDVLMAVEVPVLPSNECVKAYKDHYRQHDPSTMFCAGTGDGKGTCNGDSGSPVTVQGVMVGLTSWSKKENNECATLPDNYTRVPKYVNWLRANKKTIRNKF